MGMHRGIEYQFTGTTGTIFWFGEVIPVLKREGVSLEDCARRDIDNLLAGNRGASAAVQNSIRRRSADVPNPAWAAADAVLTDLKNRGIKINKNVYDDIRVSAATTIMQFVSGESK